jgi:PAS domain S-box-containing protein
VPDDIPFLAAKLATDHADNGVLIADMRQRDQPIVHVNATFEAITGYPASEVIGRNCRYLQGGDRLQPEIDEIRAALAEGRSCAVTLRNYRCDGSLFRNALRLLPVCGSDGAVTHMLGLVRDVTHAAGIDRLTGLFDRYGFLDALRTIAAEGKPSLLVIKIDVARFNEVNSGYGYDVGDAPLRAIAERLATLRNGAVGRTATNSRSAFSPMRNRRTSCASGWLLC